MISVLLHQIALQPFSYRTGQVDTVIYPREAPSLIHMMHAACDLFQLHLNNYKWVQTGIGTLTSLLRRARLLRV